MPTPRHTYPRSHRLHGKLAFASVRGDGLKESRGPLTLRALPNQQAHCRLGIVIGRHCGIAVVRNRVKRLIREAFRLIQNELPPGYDVVITVRRHEPLKLMEYRRLLSDTVGRLHRGLGGNA